MIAVDRQHAVAEESDHGGPSAPHFDPALVHQGPQAIVRWAKRSFQDDLILSSSFGGESAVMLHLVSRIVPSIRVVFIDTGYLFPETYRFAEDLRQRLELDIRVYAPQLTSARLEAIHGQLWAGDSSALSRYQRVTKVEPMQRALDELKPKAWLAGLRRGQTQHRASLSHVEQQGLYTKVCPILDFTDDDVKRYLKEYDLPYHPLYEQGYRSIGDVHSTRPTLDGQDAREGRKLGDQRECGLHTTLAGELQGTPVSRVNFANGLRSPNDIR
jgi:phosphoadenosine phosphosulfate reductase